MRGIISFGISFVAGRKRVPRPATGKRQLLTEMAMGFGSLLVGTQLSYEARDVLSKLLHELAILGLDEDADQRFRPRGSDENTAPLSQATLGFGDGLLEQFGLEDFFLVRDGDIAQKLWITTEAVVERIQILSQFVAGSEKGQSGE
jgi:hypothetical protein